MDRLLRAAGRCALALLLALGALAVLPRAAREAVPDSVVGGAVIVLVAVVGGRRGAGPPR
ncbi:hypothetical protein ACFWUW_09865 [Streptomyces sp. NPDC058655]|uniref:hypothetical protein n=1 Tax=unclassified Streptomyces TaxID=2593676 RepID=UPI0036498129